MAVESDHVEVVPEHGQWKQYRAWGQNPIDQDRINIFLVRVWRDEQIDATVQEYAVFSVSEGVTWHLYHDAEIIRPFLMIDGYARLVADMTDLDDSLLNRLTSIGAHLSNLDLLCEG